MKKCSKEICQDCTYKNNKLFSDQCDSCYRNMNFKRRDDLVKKLEFDDHIASYPEHEHYE